MPRKKANAVDGSREPDFITDPDGFINVPVSKKTREQLHHLKTSMGVASQAEVIEKAIAIINAIDSVVRK